MRVAIATQTLACRNQFFISRESSNIYLLAMSQPTSSLYSLFQMADTGEIQGEIIIDPDVEEVVKDLVEDVTMFVEIHIEDDTTLEPPEPKKSRVETRRPQCYGISVKGIQNNGTKIPFQAFPTGQGIFVPLLGHHVPCGTESNIGKIWNQLKESALAHQEEKLKVKQQKELRSEEECEAGPSRL